MTLQELLTRFESLRNPENVAGMARFGINSANTYGISVNVLRETAKEIGKNHELAQELWATGIHEARILASIIDVPKLVTETQMEQWVKDFDSWDVCDQCCGNLFCKTPFAYDKAVVWSHEEAEFVKRAGFVLMAYLAVHDKKAPDGRLEPFLLLIEQGADDPRNFVKKAVNWALRQIGKRSRYLNEQAIKTAESIAQRPAKSAKWIASDALKELTNLSTQQRIKR